MGRATCSILFLVVDCLKIRITYQGEWELEEALHMPLIEYIKGGAKLRKSDRYKPYKHAYITIRNRDKGTK